MRTTVALDPDVEKLIRKAMRERGETFKQVLNNAVRDALRGTPAKPSKPFRQRTSDMGKTLVDLTKLSLASELEDAEIIARMQRRGAAR